ncbi:transcription-repair coupling factor [Helicobacter sp. 23-1048]
MIQANLYSLLAKGISGFGKKCAPHDLAKGFILALRDFEEARGAFEVFALFDDFPQLTHSSNTQDSKSSKLSPLKPFLLPEMRAHYGEDLRAWREDLLTLLQTLREFYAFSNPKVLCAPISSIAYPLPKPELLEGFCVDKSHCISPNELTQKLLGFGYENVEVVEMQGEMSVRGEIIDIFLPSNDKPYRICFFGDEVESIRVFDCATQLSDKQELQNLQIPPAFFKQEYTQTNDKADSQNANDLWNLGDNGAHLSKSFCAFISQAGLKELQEITSLESNAHLTSEKDFIVLDECLPNDKVQEIDFNPKMLHSLLALHKDKVITLIAPNHALLKSYGFDFNQSDKDTDSQTLYTNPIISDTKISAKHLRAIIAPYCINVRSNDELIISFNPKNAPKRPKTRPKIQLNELTQGEFVVHNDYGIGIFLGLKSVSVLGVVSDFIEIAYAGEDKLLLPVDKLSLISRYVADSSTIPILDKLGKGSFAKLKESVRKKLLEIADGIIKLAAQRALLQGIKISRDSKAFMQFQAQCPFTLTDDQERSIKEILDDLESGRVMDRLLSGDVGFGKTEVAMNAICVLVLSGYQCAFLAPTTLLCEQHFHSLAKRFSQVLKANGKPISVARLDRFQSATQKAKTANALKQGEIDILIGTHALLGVEFANLGLVVIDEEHKFGVKQKEKIKSLAHNVHILTMSATPIPRTLNMALSSLKGFSALRTPPLERKGVRTFLKAFNHNLVREVIMREMRRGGQVFYIHNNIASIERKKAEIAQILPQCKIAILHSQIDSVQSEDTMMEFAKGAIDVLLCTSIVESGLHLPNANTIIIQNANTFGIADLHQLRGRVGRGDKEGFCYLLVEDFNTLTKEAKERLSACEKNSYLGSGENLAYHDLEIRGGGNLLGEAQSGHIKKIGYTLYLSMLEDCINYLSGRGIENTQQVDLKLNISAYISPELVNSDKLRLELYRRLSLCKELNEVYEIEGEIENRFGKLDSMSLNFLELIKIRILGNKLRLKQIMSFGENITFTQESGEKTSIKSPSKDFDDVLGSIMEYLRKTAPSPSHANN